MTSALPTTGTSLDRQQRGERRASRHPAETLPTGRRQLPFVGRYAKGALPGFAIIGPTGKPLNRNQSIALAIAAANLLLVFLFPPIDQYSIAASQLPIFAGFHFVLALPSNSTVNGSVLWLAVSVILINAAIAWLLLRARPSATPAKKFGIQNAVLVFTGANLLLALLFPPFESVFALTKAILPNFEGFYFIFFRKPSHVIVTTLLYIEMALILLNGAILWLLFKDRGAASMTPEEMRTAASRLRARNDLSG